MDFSQEWINKRGGSIDESIKGYKECENLQRYMREARKWRGGKTPIHRAAFYGHISIVKELIEERKAEINARDDGRRWTALMFAESKGKSAIGAYLVSRGGII